jgi:hypothetical protein
VFFQILSEPINFQIKGQYFYCYRLFRYSQKDLPFSLYQPDKIDIKRQWRVILACGKIALYGSLYELVIIMVV